MIFENFNFKLRSHIAASKDVEATAAWMCTVRESQDDNDDDDETEKQTKKNKNKTHCATDTAIQLKVCGHGIVAFIQ